MPKQTFVRWINLFKKNPDALLPDEREIFLITGYRSKELASPLLRKYFPKINLTRSLRDISFIDILFRSCHFAGRPGKENLSSIDRLKRTVIRHFHEDYERTANIWNLVDLIFLPSPGKCMFIASTHIVEMFKIHFPDYQVLELSGHTNAFRNWFIYVLARISRKRFTDSSPGNAVFANLADPYLLKAYHLLHPNKKIYLRFHDSIESVVKRKNIGKLNELFRQFMKENVIHGVESYYENDARSLNIAYRPNAVNSVAMEKVNRKSRSYLYTFIGTHNNRKDLSRLKDLQIIRQHLYDLYPSATHYINERIMADLSERIAYPEYLELIGLSEIIVDMYRSSPFEGFSFRIPEALILERKIITNRLNVLDCDFYDPSRIFVIGHDNIERLKSFMENDFKPLPPEIRNRYDCSYWW